MMKVQVSFIILGFISATGTRTRVAQVRAEYPNQLDYSGAGFGWSQCAFWNPSCSFALPHGSCILAGNCLHNFRREMLEPDSKL